MWIQLTVTNTIAYCGRRKFYDTGSWPHLHLKVQQAEGKTQLKLKTLKNKNAKSILKN
jgi:hypothetical protein